MNLFDNPAFRAAMKGAQKSDHRVYFHGVAVVRGGSIVTFSSNYRRIHAEVRALSKLWPNKRKGTKVWSIRITPGGKLACAKPCSNCEKYLREQGVKSVFYTTTSGSIEEMSL